MTVTRRGEIDPAAFDSEAFGARAREARAYLDLERAKSGKQRATLLELSEEMEKLIAEPVSDRDMAKWFRGERIPGTILRLWGFARVIGVDAGWLVFNGQTLAPGPTPSRPPLEDEGPDELAPRSTASERRRA